MKWPTTQKIERFTNLEANQILTIKEGSGIIKQEKINTVGKNSPNAPAGKGSAAASRRSRGFASLGSY